MVLRPGVGGIPGLFDGAQKKVAVPLKFRGRKAVVGLHAWVLGGEKMKPVLEIKDLDKNLSEYMRWTTCHFSVIQVPFMYCREKMALEKVQF